VAEALGDPPLLLGEAVRVGGVALGHHSMFPMLFFRGFSLLFRAAVGEGGLPRRGAGGLPAQGGGVEPHGGGASEPHGGGAVAPLVGGLIGLGVEVLTADPRVLLILPEGV